MTGAGRGAGLGRRTGAPDGAPDGGRPAAPPYNGGVFQLKRWHHKLFLWLAALALLAFLASLHPEIRRLLPWFRPDTEEVERPRGA